MKICPLCQRTFEDLRVEVCPNDGQMLVIQANAYAQSPIIDVPFSASLAMTFFAHHFVEQMTDGRGLQPPCQSAKVNMTHFYYELPIITFWYLLEKNFIRFQPRTKTGMFSGDYPTLLIEVNYARQGSFPGLEHDFWEIIKNSPPNITVEDVVVQFFGGKSHKPENKINRRLIEWMTHLGYGRPDDTKPFFRFGDDGDRRIFEFFPDCGRIAAQEQAVQIIHRSWTKFLVEQSQVYHYLFEDVVRGADDRVNKNSRVLWSCYRDARNHYRARFTR